MSLRDVAGRMAVIALRDPDTVGSRQMFASLGTLVGHPGLAEAETALKTIMNEVIRLRANGIPQVRMPHAAALLLAESLAEMGIAPSERTRPGVVTGSWAHDGIVPGETLSLGLFAFEDQWRDERDGRGIRIARCQVVSLGSDAAGANPYIWFRDLDRPHEGTGALPLERFRACMEAGKPEAPPPRAGR